MELNQPLTPDPFPYQIEKDPHWIVPERMLWRLVYAFSTLVAPWIGLMMFGTSKFGEAVWQDGQTSTYVELSFGQSVWTVFLPLLMFASISMGLLLFDPKRFAGFRLFRLGIYTGFVLSAQFIFQILLTDLSIGLMVGLMAIFILSVLGMIAYFGLQTLVNRLGVVNTSLGGLGLAALLLIGIAFLSEPGALLVMIPVGLIAAGIVVCPVIAFVTSIRLILVYEIEGGRWGGLLTLLVGWIAAYVASWTYAVNQIFVLYNQLPVNPPSDCYVATASARGHQRLVGSLPVPTASGEVLMVSRQLQVLKGGELALKALAPASHQTLRVVYDWIGPKLAARMGSPWLADAGYLLLKPAEWLVIGVFKCCMPGLLGQINRLYHT